MGGACSLAIFHEYDTLLRKNRIADSGCIADVVFGEFSTNLDCSAAPLADCRYLWQQ